MPDNNWVSEYKILGLSANKNGPVCRNLQRNVPGQYLPCAWVGTELKNWLPPLFQAEPLQQVLSVIVLVLVGLISDHRLSDPGVLGLQFIQFCNQSHRIHV